MIYENKKSYCFCKCKCENTKKILTGNLKKGATRSCGCLEKESRFGRKHGKNLLGQKFGKLTVIEKTQLREPNNHQIIWKCQCGCGNTSLVSTSNLNSGMTNSCGCLRQSNGERIVEAILKKNNIKFIKEYRFSNCKNKLVLSFDFYLPNHNTCIEYQGQHHFTPIKHFGDSEMFEKILLRDQIKRDYCKEHNIQLLELKYSLSNKQLQSKILNTINPVTITA